MKKWFRYLLGTLLCTFLWGMTVCAEGADKGVIALGADLSAEQKASVLSMMGVSEEELSNYTVITITNQDEHKYLDSYVCKNHQGSFYGKRSWGKMDLPRDCPSLLLYSYA